MENVARHRIARSDFKSIAASRYHDYLVGLVRDFKDNPKRYWSFVKCLKSAAHVSPVLEHGGRVYKSDEERANCLNPRPVRAFLITRTVRGGGVGTTPPGDRPLMVVELRGKDQSMRLDEISRLHILFLVLGQYLT